MINNIKKRLTGKQVKKLLKMISLTEDHEFDCLQCLPHLSVYSESQISCQQASDVSTGVEQHLAMCRECLEEFEALIKALKAENWK